MNSMRVFYDFPVSRVKVGLILYENIKHVDYEFFDVPESAYIKSSTEGSYSSSQLLEQINNLSDSNIIVITERPLDCALFCYPNCGVVASLFSPNAHSYDEKLIAKVLYIIGFVKDYYSGLLVDSNEMLLDEDGVKILLSQLPSLDARKDVESTLGKITYNSIPEPVHVLITHGIRDHAHWTENARDELLSKNINSSIFRYGWVDVFKFAFRISIREKYATELLNRLNTVIHDNRHKNISIAVHSFGSIVLARALELAETANYSIELDAIILNGSILPSKYNWKRFTNSGKNNGVTIRRVLNICGQNDCLPVVAKYLVPGAGYSGTFFFSDNYINNIINIRISDAGHSRILDKKYVKKFWGRYLLDGDFIPSTNDGVKPNKLISLLNYFLLILKFSLYILLAAIILYIFIEGIFF